MIKRYKVFYDNNNDCNCDVEEHPHGTYVEYDDYMAEVKLFCEEIDRKSMEINRLREEIDQKNKVINRLGDEIDMLWIDISRKDG